ncbi:MAG: hypothetical protein DCC55_10580 [Chloroflexi bacterium]|nr:MAG: hypothetical protein DCC55_10580 [Chloroflexota bacterium]
MAKNKVPQRYQVEDILASHTPDVVALVERLRHLIRTTVPEAVEKAYPRWHGIGYTHPQVGYFCAIFPEQNRVKLGFEFGILLPDPEGLLTGSGKQVRYVEIHRPEEIWVVAIEALLRAACALPSSRQAKLQMIQSM